MTPDSITVAQILTETQTLLEAAGVDAPRLSAQLLAAYVLGQERHVLLLDRARALASRDAAHIRALAARRATGEPVAYILGSKEFYGLDFIVSPAVLVPRPETEHLVEEVLRLFPVESALMFADLGTGSGCLAVTLALQLPCSRGLALDRSVEALAVALANACAHGVQDRLQLLRGDFGQPFAVPGSLDFIVSNPPYVSDVEYRETSHEVHGFEPRAALVPAVSDESGGLECYRALIPRAATALRPGGALLLEIGWLQGRAVAQVVEQSGFFEDLRVLPDLAGRDRVVVARRA